MLAENIYWTFVNKFLTQNDQTIERKKDGIVNKNNALNFKLARSSY